MILIADDYAQISAALAALEAAKRAPVVMALTPVPDSEKDGYAIADVYRAFGSGPLSDLVSAFQSATEAALSDVNTASPGNLISYNHDTNRAVVRASLPKALADGRDLPRRTSTRSPWRGPVAAAC